MGYLTFFKEDKDLDKIQADLQEPFRALVAEGVDFVLHYHWCKRVERVWVDRGFDKALVLFMKFEAAPPAEEDCTWIIVGDLPPAYIDVGSNANGAVALKSYIHCIESYVRKARAGESLYEEIAVRRRGSLESLEPNSTLLDLLERRMAFLRRELLPHWEEEIRLETPHKYPVVMNTYQWD